MEKFLESLVNLIPFAQQLEKLKIKPETCVALSAIINALLVFAVIALSGYLVNHYKNSRAARQLAPYFNYQKVKASRRYFIPTQGQNHSPAHEEEPQSSTKFIVKKRLITHFIKTAFNEKKETEKFYLILADSGMGKTTFMINLFVQYTSFFNFSRKYKIRLFPFGDSRIMDEIKAINREDKLNTILLLDAFDEYQKLVQPAEPDGMTDDARFRCRLDEIIEVVRDFREVVITSRTQYFPGQEDKPYELKIPSFDEQGFHILAKLYLSPFDNREIRCYLRKKYGVLRFWNRKKKKTAAAVVKNSPKLMVRPMLLGYIDYLVDKNRVFQTTWDIYATLVDKWLDREAVKRKHRSEDREKFKNDLYTYSRLVAVGIYRQRKLNAQLSLKKDDAAAIAQKNGLDLSDYEITGQSLLTRDAEGTWKFAHKSIWEFLIAGEAADNLSFWFNQNFQGMDMTAQFLSANLPGMPLPADFVFIKGGTFMMGSPGSEAGRADNETQHQVELSDFYLAKYTVTVAQFETFASATNYKMACDMTGQKEKQHPVVNISWNDAAAYCSWLSKTLNITFRLPTEAEWEYACRAGTTTPFNTGENLTTEQANYNENYPYNNNSKGKYIKKTTPVGTYPPNAWGLYDMHGNVWEWCLDWYGEKYYNECKQQGVTKNPKGPERGSSRVLRGGSWSNFGRGCRSAYRSDRGPGNRGSGVGLRLVFVPQSVGS